MYLMADKKIDKEFNIEADYKVVSQDILDVIRAYSIDGDPELPYSGPYAPGPALVSKTLDCLRLLALDKAAESDDLVLDILSAIPCVSQDEFYDAVVQNAQRCGNFRLVELTNICVARKAHDIEMARELSSEVLGTQDRSNDDHDFDVSDERILH